MVKVGQILTCIYRYGIVEPGDFMESIIKEKLEEIEQKENVKILYCIESGSRAWGFASPDSDYDVRFIYIRPNEFYLKLEKTSDVIEWQLDDVLDINGWDLQKMLRLVHNSNPTVFEWKNSPIVYRKSDNWDNIAKVIDLCFQPKASLYHYLNMAKKNYAANFKNTEVKYKKYFYVLRPLLACQWILRNNEPAPMLFSDLMVLPIPEDIRLHINNLLKIKMSSDESKTGKRIGAIDDFIEKSISDIEHQINCLPKAEKVDWNILNDCFLSMVN